MVAAEAAPMAKVGGLADVVCSLSPALHGQGIDIRVVMPLYGSIDRDKYKLKKIYSDLEVPSGRVLVKVNIWESKLPGSQVLVYYIDAPVYFRYKEVYVKGDNSERFLFLSLASLYLTVALKWRPDLVHCQDSHTGLIPSMLYKSPFMFLEGIKTLFSIHNFNYQGVTDAGVLSTGNLHPESTKFLSIDASDGDVNFMAQGVMGADIVNTVSPTYAREIATSVYGAGLERVIRRRKNDLYGILNGIDTGYFDPSADDLIYQRYSVRSLGRKKKNKLELQKELGLPRNEGKCVVGLVSRLVWQKGLELITANLRHLDCQFVFLGTGSPRYEKHLSALAEEYPERFSAQIMFDIELAQKIYAASDIFLMPSRYEPCGLGQMIAMRYGTLPLVRSTGGLADTVDKRVGFSFKDISRRELYDTLKDALEVYYHHPEKWRKMQKRAMKRDFSWKRSAREYVKLYKKALKKKREQ